MCLDKREAYDGVVFIVAGAGEGRADTGVLKVGSVSIKGGFVGERGGKRMLVLFFKRPSL